LWDKISGFFGGVVDRIKDFFGIHSPSTLFAELGGNMGQGIGVGFEKAMGQVGKDMQNAIPTDFDMQMQSTVTGAETSTTAGLQPINVTIPLTVDGIMLARVISQLQWSQNTVTVRNLGVNI
jgi:hypothetical protein